MRSLVRTRTLTALCALLLVFASIAHAGVPGRPIDRPGGPPDPDPTMVGDPDEPGNLRTLTLGIFGHVYLIHLPAGVARKLHLLSPVGRASSCGRSNHSWGPHAR